MRRESVATLESETSTAVGPPQRPREGRQDSRHPLPAAVVQHLDRYLTQYLPTEVDDIKPDTLVNVRATAPGPVIACNFGWFDQPVFLRDRVRRGFVVRRPRGAGARDASKASL